MTGTFEGVGSLQFSPDNKRCYAYSGSIENTSGAGAADIELLDFTTGSEYIIAKIQVTHTHSSGHDFYLDIKFNDLLIVQMKEDATEVEAYPFLIRLVIPPFTNVNIKIGANTAGYFYQANIIGKVKGAIQQENLEAITNNNKWASL